MDTYLPMRGNLVNDPKQTQTASGAKVTRFRLVASGRRFDQRAQEFVDTDPVFMSVTCWRTLGDNVMQSLRKGDTVIVYGRLRFSEYDDAKSGVRRQSYEIDAQSVGPDLSRYVTALTRPPRELPDAEPGSAAAALPQQPSSPETNPWTEPVRPSGEEAA